MGDPRHDLGRAAEEAVARWLAGHGWRILDARHRSAEGEIDLVALDPDQVLVAVEVRLRRSGRSGDALASVRPRHLRRVSAALVRYARECGTRHRGLRIDLVGVAPGPQPGTWRLRRLPAIDAW